MYELVAKSINPKVGHVLVPAFPLFPIQHDSNHPQTHQETPHVPAVAGLTELAAVIETNEEAKQLIENVVDLNALISEIAELPKDPASPEVTAAGRNMLSSPEALAAVRAEADGLRAVPTWDEDNPREFEDVRNESRKAGVKVHFGKLMTIAVASIKFYELAKHLQKMKGQIVYRVTVPRMKKGRQQSTANLGPTRHPFRAYTPAWHTGPCRECNHDCGCYQSICPGIPDVKLSNLDRTAARTASLVVRRKFARPAVLLLRALCGHPEAGGLFSST